MNVSDGGGADEFTGRERRRRGIDNGPEESTTMTEASEE